jgi:Rod binding domain-containing protein
MKIDAGEFTLQKKESILYGVSAKSDNTELKEAVNDFVSILLAKVFKDMDQSIPRSELTQESFGQSWYREMVMDEYAKTAAKQSLKSLGETVYRQLTGGKREIIQED